MNIQSNLEINFHQPDEASIFLKNTAGGKEEKFGEILLFCCFALRTIVNFGRHPAAGQIAIFLSEFGKKLNELAEHGSPDGSRLVDYKGTTGKRRFLVTLICNDNNFNFQYKPKGLGFFWQWNS